MTHAVPFQWNVECMVCRKKTKSSKARTRWDGLIVCEDEGCYETRHPLDIPLPPVREQTKLPFTSPEGSESSTGVEFNDNIDQTGVPGGTFDSNNGTF